jgi:uncharacterized membrane protein YfcA
MIQKSIRCALAGFCAGAITGLFGAGGGMILVPLLALLTDMDDDSIFPSSVSVILPVCVVCLIQYSLRSGLPWKEALPYLIGSCGGGFLAGLLGKKLPVIWLHRLLGALVLWGGIRYLC